MSLTNFDRQLASNWSEFRTIPPKPVDTGDGATIGVTWDVNHSPARNGNAIIVAKIDVKVIMDPNMCTVVENKKSNYLLKHEQGHYDIIALAAREFYQKAQKITASTDVELTSKISDLFTEIKDKADIVDDRYDTATNHSINTAVQQTWNQKIDTAKKNPAGTVDDLP